MDRNHVDNRGGDGSRQHPHFRRRRLPVHHQQHRRQYAAIGAATAESLRKQRSN